MSNKLGKPNIDRSGSWIEDRCYNNDLREGGAEGVGSARKVAKHTSVPSLFANP
jgi:hypothetical protein